MSTYYQASRKIFEWGRAVRNQIISVVPGYCSYMVLSNCLLAIGLSLCNQVCLCLLALSSRLKTGLTHISTLSPPAVVSHPTLQHFSPLPEVTGMSPSFIDYLLNVYSSLTIEKYLYATSQLLPQCLWVRLGKCIMHLSWWFIKE
jgi:hypothetical protein